MDQYWAQEANKALMGQDAKAQWKQAKHRARTLRMLHEHDYLPSVYTKMDMDGNIKITWKDAANVVGPLQTIADDMFGLFCGIKNRQDKLADREAGMVLAAIWHANLPDKFSGLFGADIDRPIDYLARWWGR